MGQVGGQWRRHATFLCNFSHHHLTPLCLPPAASGPRSLFSPLCTASAPCNLGSPDSPLSFLWTPRLLLHLPLTFALVPTDSIPIAAWITEHGSSQAL